MREPPTSDPPLLLSFFPLHATHLPNQGGGHDANRLTGGVAYQSTDGVPEGVSCPDTVTAAAMAATTATKASTIDTPTQSTKASTRTLRRKRAADRRSERRVQGAGHTVDHLATKAPADAAPATQAPSSASCHKRAEAPDGVSCHMNTTPPAKAASAGTTATEAGQGTDDAPGCVPDAVPAPYLQAPTVDKPTTAPASTTLTQSTTASARTLQRKRVVDRRREHRVQGADHTVDHLAGHGTTAPANTSPARPTAQPSAEHPHVSARTTPGAPRRRRHSLAPWARAFI